MNNKQNKQGKRRKNGEGTWGTKNIKGTQYKFYRDVNGKYFYGHTDKEINEKRQKFDEKKITNKTTFGEYMLWYFKNIHRNRVEESTYAEYIRVANVIINCKYYDIGSMQLSSFSEANNYVKEYIEAITPHYSYNYIKNQFTKIRMVIRYAEGHKRIEKGLMEEAKLPKEGKVGNKARKAPLLPKDVIDKMYSVIDDKYYIGTPKYGFDYWVVLLIIHTGLRMEEVRGIRLGDVDFKNQKLYINEAIVKIKSVETEEYTYKIKSTKNSSSERAIPLNIVSTDMLKRIIDFSKPQKSTDFICINKCGNYIKNIKVTSAANRILRDVNSPITHCNPHALRHTFGSILFEEGEDLKVISELMGHSSIVTTANIYVGITAKKKDLAIQRLEPLQNENKECATSD